MKTSLFQKKPLGEVLTFNNGKSIKPGGTGAHPVYGSNGLIGGSDSYKEENAIIIGRVGAYCGSVAYQKGKFWASDNTIVASPKDRDHDVRFFFYLLKGMNLNRWAGGAAQPLLTQSILKQVEAPIPKAAIQKEIASIISAYDDLIENNTRRIKILEEMAQSLYREWFINFRFPGHEKAKFIDSPLGKIPEGCSVLSLGDIADVQWGDTATTKASYIEDGYDAYSASGKDGKLDHYDYDKTGIVLSAIGANCGITWLARGKWSCIKNTIRIFPYHDITSVEYLYLATKGKDFWPKRGAAQPFISQGDAKSKQILLSKKRLVEEFTVFARALLRQANHLEEINITLHRTRDHLLPRLISSNNS